MKKLSKIKLTNLSQEDLADREMTLPSGECKSRSSFDE